ncbi:MAG: putative toxin-antitoxin system toxin component, PIN family [Bergeyella sp.]
MSTKIILDVNIWVSYFITGRFSELSAIILNKNIQVHTCKEMIDELQDVLSRKKFEHRLNLPVDFYVNLHKELTLFSKIKICFSGSPDRNDDYLFDLAIQTESKILVTGDKKLLNFETKEVEMISLSEFLERYK